MRIAQVIPHICNEASGPTHYMLNLEKHLTALDCHVDVFSLDSYRYLRFMNLGISIGLFNDLKKAANHVDILHNNSLWMMPNLYAYWAANKATCKVVTSPHGTLSKWALAHGKLKKAIWGTLLQYPALKRTDMFHATCEKEYNEIRDAGFRQPVAIIPIGIDIPELKGCVLKNPEPISGRLKKVVFLGRLHKVKAVDNLIKAWEAVVDKFLDWELVIAGPDGGAQRQLEALVAQNGIPRVKFVGEINGISKYLFLAESDLYVLPSHTENFAVTVAEALACGTPVIASYGSPWRELKSRNAGWWIPIGVAPLVEQLMTSLALPREVLLAMGMNGCKWMREEFDWNTIAQKMKNSYEWLCGKGDKPNWIVED